MKLSMSMFASRADLEAAKQKQDAARYQALKGLVFLEHGIVATDEWETEIDDYIASAKSSADSQTADLFGGE
jgi:hypothetical protein